MVRRLCPIARIRRVRKLGRQAHEEIYLQPRLSGPKKHKSMDNTNCCSALITPSTRVTPTAFPQSPLWIPITHRTQFLFLERKIYHRDDWRAILNRHNYNNYQIKSITRKCAKMSRNYDNYRRLMSKWLIWITSTLLDGFSSSSKRFAYIKIANNFIRQRCPRGTFCTATISTINIEALALR